MLPSSARLTEREAFREVTRRGRKAARAGMVVHVLAPPQRGSVAAPAPYETTRPVRVGFVVGRRVGPATVRNRVRRRLRHLMVARRGQVAPGSQVVVRALPPSATMSYQQLGVQLDQCLASAGSTRGRPPGRGA